MNFRVCMHTLRICIALVVVLLLSGCDWSIEAVEETTDQQQLEKIYKQSSKTDVRKAALAKVDSQELLFNVANGYPSPADDEFRVLAISKLSDENLVKLIQRYRFEKEFQDAVLEAIDDQQVLAQLLLSKKSEKWTNKVFPYITDDRAFQTINKEHKSYKVSVEAFKKITDQNIIFEIMMANVEGAKISTDWNHIQSTLTDENLITEHIIKSSNTGSRGINFSNMNEKLVEKVHNQKLLSEIAKKATRKLPELALKRITDKDALHDVLLHADNWYVREKMVERVTDPAILIEAAAKAPSSNLYFIYERQFNKFAKDRAALIKKWESWLNERKTAEVTDQALLAEIALGASRFEVRKIAVNKLQDDHDALWKIAKLDDQSYIREIAMGKINDQNFYADVAENDNNSETRLFAAKRLTDPALVQHAFEQKGLTENRNRSSFAEKYANRPVRLFLLSKIENQKLLKSVVANPDYDVAYKRIALKNINDQVYLREVINTENAATREVAVESVTDDEYLLSLMSREPSKAVRTAIVNAMTDSSFVENVATGSFWTDDRQTALNRLQQSFNRPTARALSVHKSIYGRAEKLRSGVLGTEENISTALSGKFDVWRTAAADGLSEIQSIEQVALKSKDRDVLRIMLAKLIAQKDTNIDTAKNVAADAVAPSMRLAVAEQIGLTSWNKIFEEATAIDATAEMLEHALNAVNLHPKALEDVKDAVQNGALDLIRNGDENRIGDLGDMLERYGDKRLAEDYVNSGHPDLASAARAWARKRGYSEDTGSGSSRAHWGSRKN